MFRCLFLLQITNSPQCFGDVFVRFLGILRMEHFVHDTEIDRVRRINSIDASAIPLDREDYTR